MNMNISVPWLVLAIALVALAVWLTIRIVLSRRRNGFQWTTDLDVEAPADCSSRETWAAARARFAVGITLPDRANAPGGTHLRLGNRRIDLPHTGDASTSGQLLCDTLATNARASETIAYVGNSGYRWVFDPETGTVRADVGVERVSRAPLCYPSGEEVTISDGSRIEWHNPFGIGEAIITARVRSLARTRRSAFTSSETPDVVWLDVDPSESLRSILAAMPEPHTPASIGLRVQAERGKGGPLFVTFDTIWHAAAHGCLTVLPDPETRKATAQ